MQHVEHGGGLAEALLQQQQALRHQLGVVVQAEVRKDLQQTLAVVLQQEPRVAVAVVVESGRCERGRQSGWTAG